MATEEFRIGRIGGHILIGKTNLPDNHNAISGEALPLWTDC
jgi:hypothetical protein